MTNPGARRIRWARLRAAAAAAFDDGWNVLNAILAAVPAWWAFALAIEPPTFRTAPAIFRVMSELGTESEWSMICAFASAFGFLGMLIPVRGFQLFAAGILAAWHGLISLTIFAGVGLSGTGTGVYALLALGATLSMIQRVR